MTPTLVAATVLIALGAVLLGGVGWLYLVALRSAAWVATEGRVVSASLAGDHTTVNPSSTSPVSRALRLVVTYRYEAGGRAFTGSRVHFGDSMWGARWIRGRDRSAELARYTPDAVVTVYYDPAHPSRATLWRTVPHASFQQLLIVAVLFILAGIGVLNGVVKVR